MGRPKGAKNRGFSSQLSQKTKQLIDMLNNNQEFSLETFSRTANSFRKMMDKAIKRTPYNDAQAVQRVSTGLNALAKALSVIQKVEEAKSIQKPLKLYDDYDSYSYEP